MLLFTIEINETNKNVNKQTPFRDGSHRSMGWCI